MKQLGAYWDALPVPVTPEGRPPEFNELMSFIEFGRKTLTPPLKGLIKSNAGNWPIHWLDFRAKTAAVRDQFALEQLESDVLINVGRIPVYKDDQEPSMYVEFDRGYSGQDGMWSSKGLCSAWLRFCLATNRMKQRIIKWCR